jgi:hypothetical protein
VEAVREPGDGPGKESFWNDFTFGGKAHKGGDPRGWMGGSAVVDAPASARVCTFLQLFRTDAFVRAVSGPIRCQSVFHCIPFRAKALRSAPFTALGTLFSIAFCLRAA